MKQFTIDELEDISAKIDGGGVWLMTVEQYRLFKQHPHWKDCNGYFIFIPPELGGYGTLLNRKIAIVDFEYFGIARI